MSADKSNTPSNSRSFLAACLSVCLATLASACATPGFEADVTRFHAISGPINNQTLRIEPSQAESGQAEFELPGGAGNAGLEFTRYANIVGDTLATHGFSPAGEAEPDVIAQLGYSVSNTDAVDSGSSSRVGVGVGGGSGGHGSGISLGLGTSFNLGGGPKPVFLRRLTLVLIDQASGEPIFEGSAASRGTSPDLAEAMPLLVRALLSDFPGQSGRTVRVKLDVVE